MVESAPPSRPSGHGSAPSPAYPAPVTVRRRLDAELVRRGLLGSRRQAVEAIVAGRVRVGGSPTQAPARLVGAGEPIQLTGDPPRFVSRGGEKLAAALAHFAVDVRGRRVLDAGASTGGFTDCLLQAGAAQVHAVDVGRGQLAWSLRHDPRVTVRERTNVRDARARRPRRPGRRHRRRPVVHLAAHGRARARPLHPIRRRPRPPGEAAVRSGTGAAGQGRDRARPRRPPGGAPRGA